VFAAAFFFAAGMPEQILSPCLENNGFFRKKIFDRLGGLVKAQRKNQTNLRSPREINPTDLDDEIVYFTG